MKQIICFGAGKYLEKRFEVIKSAWNILCICDNDSLKWGKEFMYHDVPTGVFIVSPNVLKNEVGGISLLITSSYVDEIVCQLEEMGIDKFYVVGGGPEYITYKYQELLWNDIIKNSIKEIIKDETRYPINIESNLVHTYRLWSNIFSHKQVQKILPYLTKTSKILDYGCGCGTAVLNLLLLGYDAYGIDIDARRYTYIMQLIDDLSLPIEWKEHFMLYDGKRICFENNKFDFVLSLHVLEHVSDCRESVKEMLRVCKKNGYLHLECPNYDAFYEKHFLLDFGKPLRGNKTEFCTLVKEIGGREEYAQDLNFINGSDVYNMFIESGFTVEVIHYYFLAAKEGNGIVMFLRKK